MKRIIAILILATSVLAQSSAKPVSIPAESQTEIRASFEQMDKARLVFEAAQAKYEAAQQKFSVAQMKALAKLKLNPDQYGLSQNDKGELEFIEKKSAP